MRILVNGTTVTDFKDGAIGIPFEVDDFPGFQDGKVLHWDGIDWWYERDVLEPQEVLAALFAASPETLESLPDSALERMSAYMHEWEVGKDYIIGDLRQYDEKPYRCLQAHTSIQEWNPEEAVSLWARVLAGGDDVPVWEQPESTNPYMKGDKVHFPTKDDPVYVSTIDYNVYAPNVYGWELES